MDVIVDELVRLIFGMAAAVIVPAVSAIAVQYLRKLNLQVSAEQQAKIEHLAMLAVTEAEEYASRKLKANLPVSSGDKLNRAIGQLRDRVPGLTSQDATDVIHAVLPRIGTGAAAALGEWRRPTTNEVH